MIPITDITLIKNQYLPEKKKPEGIKTMDRQEVNRFTLNGDFSTDGVKEQFTILVQHITGVVEVMPVGLDRSPPLKIDLHGVQTLDACGCQLLTLFFRKLKMYGIEICSVQLSADCRKTIHCLGFEDEL